MRKSTLMVGSTLFAVAIATAQPAFAQDAAPAEDCVDANNNGVCDSDEGGTIVVTGTRIARPTLESAIPLTSVTTDDIQGTGEVSLGDALNDLPSLRSTFSQGNSSRFIGTAGLSLLDLRGLGTARTLVLVNGRRHITSTPGFEGFDVNTVPTDLVTRIDIITGGNSAVYGSDAVAGVVNFILKRDFDGLTARAQGGISSRGDRGAYFASITGGRNFADGRGNVALSFEYTRQQPMLLRDRDALTGAFSGRCQFQRTENVGGEPAAGDGISDTTFICGVRNAAISDGGTIGVLSNATGAALRFADDGSLFVDTPTASFLPFGSGNVQGGRGTTLSEIGSLLAGVDRYAANLLFHYDFSDAFRPFLEAKYVRTDVTGEGQASFFSSVPGTLGGPAMRCNNGFLSAQALTTLQGFGICTNVAAGTFPMARFNTDLGGRGFDGTRETYRAVVGINGDFNDDWKYEVALNYGRFEAFGRNTNNLLLFKIDGSDFDGFNRAIDAVVAPVGFTGTNFATNATGQRVICRVNATTNVDPACVPLNLFGRGNYDARAFDYVHSDGTTDEFASQLVASANVSGDFSQLFELPGGPISFALGAEYRRERGSIDYDELTSADVTFLNALQDVTFPQLEVKEAYGELQFPLLENMPFARELVVTLAGRVSDYNNSTGTVYAYNIQGVYAPIEDVRFRVAYATSVRAPQQGDLFSPQSTNFANGLADPCDQGNINAAPNRVANCAAGGIPTTANAAVVAACATTSFPTVVGAPWLNCAARTSGIRFAQGGNPTLQEERGRSLTIGAVFEPSFLPGFNFTVDYYDIEVRDAIAVLGAQLLINLCYDSPNGISNPFCATVNRDPATGLFGTDAVISGGVNFAKFTSEGIDIDMSYRHTFENGHKLAARFIGTRVLNRDNFTDPTLPNDPNRQRSELGDPSYSASFNLDYDFGNWDLRWTTQYIGRQTIGTYETQNSYYATCPASGITQNTGGINGAAVPCTAGQLITVAPNNADAFPRIWYPDVFYHHVRIGWDINDKFRFYAGVNNLFDRQPPLGLLGTAGGDPFDSFGRNFFFGISADL
ncbi:MAG: TonB-dependent receptor [Sphingopyxis sp.]